MGTFLSSELLHTKGPDLEVHLLVNVSLESTPEGQAGGRKSLVPYTMVDSWDLSDKNRSIGPELMTAKTGPIHLSSLVEIAFVD